MVKGLVLKAEMDWETNNEGVAWRESTFKAIVWDGWNIIGSLSAISLCFSAWGAVALFKVMQVFLRDGDDLEVKTNANLPDGWKAITELMENVRSEWQVFFLNGNGLLKSVWICSINLTKYQRENCTDVLIKNSRDFTET